LLFALVVACCCGCFQTSAKTPLVLILPSAPLLHPQPFNPAALQIPQIANYGNQWPYNASRAYYPTPATDPIRLGISTHFPSSITNVRINKDNLKTA
jgi:hypothetical protein